MEEFPEKHGNICSHHSLEQHFGQNPFNLFSPITVVFLNHKIPIIKYTLTST